MAPLVDARRPAKTVSEATRERETFRYDPSLVAEFNFLRDGNLVPGSKLANSADATLTGLAQLGAYQTGTERAFISLFDANHQYVIAETAPSMRIAPSLANDLSNPLVLCGSAIPRDQGTCDHVLYLPANPDGKDPAELPLSYVPNLVTDPRFSDRPYCQFGEAGQFYAAVPIRTRRGINIGAYCVMSQKRPQGWNDGSPRHLRDVSYAIMDYLEQRRIMSMSRMHERLNRGLGSFIEGKSTLGRWQNQLHHEAFMSASNKREGVLNATQQHLEQQKQDALEEDEAVQRNGRVEEWRGGSTSAEAAHSVDGSASSQKPAVRRSADSFATGKGFSPAAKDPDAVEDEPKRVFSRAANIIREAFEVEGCVFMDVAIGAYTLPPDSESSESADHVSATSSGEESAAVNQTTAPMCDVLGFSTTDTSSINGDGAINIDESIVHHIGKLPSRFLAALLRRYPDGKIFNFDAIGELQQTESSEEDTASVGPPNSDPTEQEQPEKLHGPFSRKREGEVIHQAFPSARSVAFIPMRDLKRDRWLAGGFVYTLDPTRVISAEGELSFLRAFEKAITSELLKLETRRIERARSDALGSLSHELRSPLHGVILGTELLNDTELSGFQGNTTHMIETCGRTLLDTIDHLLDYSKVNSFERNSRKESSTHLSGPPSLRKRTMSSQFGKKLYANIRLDGVIEEVAQGVFAGFSFQYKSIQQLSSPGSISTDLTAQKQLDGMQAMEQLSPTQNTDKGQECFQFGLVSVYLCIDPTSNWAFYMQPGAIRRIFMNLFGNSLKYTTSGYIRVSLTQEPHNARRSTSEKLVQLTVQDTGKGMGQDFMRHRLFKPFSQEDELTPGTGLGLSLVKTMVSQLGGRINVQSQRGVGTTITVRLPLEQSSQTRDMPNSVTEGDEEFEEQLRELKGLRVRICGFEGAHDDERGIVEGICRDWLKMEVVADSGNAPDVILRSSSALPANFEMTAQLATTPNVVVCRDALAAYQQLKKYESIEQDGVLEFISQPIGPRVFAKSLLLVYQRWMGLAKIKAQTRPPGPRRAQSLYNSDRLLAQSEVARATPPITPDDGAEAKSEAGFPSTQLPRADGEPPMPESATDEANTILLVDDNCINLKILAAYMTKLGCTHEMAVNGKEAVDRYVAHPEQFAAILMDISMPVMDGLEATRLIRAHERTNKLEKVAILALTGLASEGIHREASDSGVDLFLTKPVRLKVLGEALESIDVLGKET